MIAVRVPREGPSVAWYPEAHVEDGEVLVWYARADGAWCVYPGRLGAAPAPVATEDAALLEALTWLAVAGYAEAP